MRAEARREERRIRLRAASGVMDFFGVVASALLILAMCALLAGLYAWLRTDLSESFADLQKNVTDALFVKR